MKTFDVKQEGKMQGVADNKGNCFKAPGQQFFYSSSR